MRETLLWPMSCSLVVDDSSMQSTAIVEEKAVSRRRRRRNQDILSYTSIRATSPFSRTSSLCHTVNSFIHIEHLYSASSRKLLRSAPNSSMAKKSCLSASVSITGSVCASVCVTQSVSLSVFLSLFLSVSLLDAIAICEKQTQVTRLLEKYKVQKGGCFRSRAHHGECAALLSGGMGKRDKEKTLLGRAER